MAKLSIQREQSQLLILPARQLNAALRKSAQRAQRLADAFGKHVPSEPTQPRAKASGRTSPAKAPAAR